jgi:flagellar hook-associated protein 3 FlgL
MITNLDASAEIFLADLNRAQRRQERAQRQISSGKLIQAPSDAPDQIDTLLQLRAAAEHNTQIKANLNRAATEAQGADSALNATVKVLDRALVLAAQGVDILQTTQGRASLATEVQSLMEQMVAFSQTSVEGRFIFSGDADLNPSYEIDWTSDTGVTRLTTAGATRRLEDPAGGSFLAARTAQDIFDHRNPDDTVAPDNAFAALNTLRLALLNDDTQAVQNSIDAIRFSAGHVNEAIAFYGSLETRIQDATNFASTYAVQLETDIGRKQDADITAAALAVSQSAVEIQAALSARARIPRTTLFDLLG